MSSQASTSEWLPPLSVGLHDTKRDVALSEAQLHDALDCNYNMLTSFITNNHFRQSVEASIAKHAPNNTIPIVPGLTYLDTHLEPSSMASSMVAFTSPWIDVCSPDPLIAGVSKQVLLLEVSFAAFCGFDQVVIQGPKLHHYDSLRGEDVLTDNTTEFARMIQECLNAGMRLQISILLPFSDDAIMSEKPSKHLTTRNKYIEPDLEAKLRSDDLLATWETWNTIRTSCKYNSRLHVALEMPSQLPGINVQSRWFSEPVKSLFFDESCFTSSLQGYPIFQPSVRDFVKDMMRLRIPPWIVLTDVGSIPASDGTGVIPCADGSIPDEMVSTTTDESTSKTSGQFTNKDPLAHLNYIRYLERKQEPRSRMERDTAGYQDYLQFPLQPLTDNLESATYEVFEKDPVKYDLYEQAIRKALRDWSDEQKPTSGSNGEVVVVVAGAGRGPLVTRALRAGEIENVAIDLWVIEKNPNAFVLLQRNNRGKWKGQVNLELSDMRSWRGPWKNAYSPTPAEASAGKVAKSVESKAYYPIDIMISELLGSFGDNELSPECLDGISHLIAKPHGISIPRSYTAWLTPVSAPRLHTDLLQRASYDAAAHETPAVVWLNQIDYLSSEPRPSNSISESVRGQRYHTNFRREPIVLCAWEFKHVPDSDSASSTTTVPGSTQQVTAPYGNSHNSRFAKLTFRTRYRGVCHGLGGYFESVLYPGVELSINPNTIDEKSKDMTSWFPIFFPLKTPLYVPGISTLDVSMWRQTNGRKVWYEWLIESYGWNLTTNSVTTRAENEDQAQKRGGRGGVERPMVRIGTTELHSSIKNACLM